MSSSHSFMATSACLPDTAKPPVSGIEKPIWIGLAASARGAAAQAAASARVAMAAIRRGMARSSHFFAAMVGAGTPARQPCVKARAKRVALVVEIGYLPAIPARARLTHGRSEEEGIDIAARHAPLASRAAAGELRRMLELRRDEAPAPYVPRMRPLRRTRGGGDARPKRPDRGCEAEQGLSARITVALDAMGGDRAPDMVLQGAASVAARAIPRRSSCSSATRRSWSRAREAPRLAGRASPIHHTDESGDRRCAALGRAAHRAAHSSMRLAIDAVADGKADCVVSAGNTGALMAMAMFGLRMMPGIDRPAMAIVLPDAARRERDARSGRQCRMRCREPGAVRADGRGLRPHRAGPARIRPSACSMSAPRR